MVSYTLIKGNFHVVRYSPDGDSMMFRADNNSLWDHLKAGSDPACFKKFKISLGNKKDKGAVQLRLLGIDALETHYRNFSQPTDLGMQAAEAFMKFMGIQDLIWKKVFDGNMVQMARLKGSKEKIEIKQADRLPGYIVASGVEDNGRPLAWVFAGTCPDRDGALWDEKKLVGRVAKSANYHLLRKGLVYPYFFESLPAGLQKKLARAAKSACEKGSCVWGFDKSMSGLKGITIKMITEDTVMFPYLFRKIIKHVYKPGVPPHTSLNLAHLLKREKFINEVILWDKGILRMKKQPWEIVFQDSW